MLEYLINREAVVTTPLVRERPMARVLLTSPRPLPRATRRRAARRARLG